MKVSDYIVEFLIQKGIDNVFGYPGGMVTHLMDSFSKYNEKIQAHVCYHEQAASFEACAYAQASNRLGVAYATSGPGATNLITGICNAYFDSIPVLFITGQVNTFESKGSYNIRQRGFQETDIVSMVKNVTKYAVYVEDENKIGFYLEKAYQLATTGRKGPVLLDIPMNIQRSEIEVKELERYVSDIEYNSESADYSTIVEKLQNSKRPCILLGAALKSIEQNEIIDFAEHMQIPIITSMVAIDLLPYNYQLNYGFIGAYGNRTANFIAAKSDLVLSIGSRLDVRQVGGKRSNFAPNATIIRVDIDKSELEYCIRENDISIQADALAVMKYLIENYTLSEEKYSNWKHVCDYIRNKLWGLDKKNYNLFVEKISEHVPQETVITTDVGQNQVWVAQSFQNIVGQRVLFSGGHGAMGYSLPAAIGAYYATKKPVICFNGDGGFQMNMQELEFIRREQIPIKIFIFNNYSLGMIRHFQEMYFEGNYTQTVGGMGYDTPDFKQIAKAYEIKYICYEKPADINNEFMLIDGPVFAEIKLHDNTHVFPKIEFGKPNQDQEPLIDRELFEELMVL